MKRILSIISMLALLCLLGAPHVNAKQKAFPFNLVFQAQQLNHTSLISIDIWGKNPVQFVANFTGRQPAFDATGKRMAFVSNRRNPMRLDELLLLNFQTGKQLFLKTPHNTNVSPAFSPDGGKVVFVSGYFDPHGPEHSSKICTISADGSRFRTLTKGPDDYTPQFSPDGTKIVYTTGESSDADLFFTDKRSRQIVVINADGTHLQQLTNTTADEMQPKFTPDGQRIVFFSTRDGNREIYIMNVDGSNAQRLTNNSGSDWEPCVSPDGQHIAWSSNRTGKFQIYLMNPDGTGQRQLTFNNYNATSPA